MWWEIENNSNWKVGCAGAVWKTWKNMRTKWKPPVTFRHARESFLGEFGARKFMKNHVFWEPRFFNKKHDFLKIVLPSRREAHFWGSGSVLEVRGTDQNRKKWAQDPSKITLLKEWKKSWYSIKNASTWTRKSDGPVVRISCYSLVENIKLHRFLRSRIGHFWALGVILGGQKSSKIMNFRKVKNMKNAWQGYHFWHVGLSKRRKKGERKSMKFREKGWGQKLRIFAEKGEKWLSDFWAKRIAQSVSERKFSN